MTDIQSIAEKIIKNVENVILGKADAVRLTVIGLLCQGHVLIEDVPGTGKTMLAKSIAKSTGCTFNRIQFTPDMLPSDVTGVSIFNQKTREFEFRPGPILNQIVLTDEINRATPKTQAALLEVMEEGQVTVDGVTHHTPEPFLVLATQNPIEYEGTFPLPEAQMDRFLMRINLGYPDGPDEIRMLEEQQIVHPIENLERVVSVDEIIDAQKAVREQTISDDIKRYIVDLVDMTRRHTEVF
ncbi:MAG: AAA family ATPase [Anaerolineales bacterium]